MTIASIESKLTSARLGVSNQFGNNSLRETSLTEVIHAIPTSVMILAPSIQAGIQTQFLPISPPQSARTSHSLAVSHLAHWLKPFVVKALRHWSDPFDQREKVLHSPRRMVKLHHPHWTKTHRLEHERSYFHTPHTHSPGLHQLPVCHPSSIHCFLAGPILMTDNSLL
jgi:hypothetical protein